MWLNGGWQKYSYSPVSLHAFSVKGYNNFSLRYKREIGQTNGGKQLRRALLGSTSFC